MEFLSGNKRKLDKKKPIELPSSVIIHFQNGNGDRVGSSIEIPMNTTNKQMEQVLNSVLNHSDAVPYAFYIKDFELVDSLQDTLSKMCNDGTLTSFEETLVVSYQPLSVFKVRPITRCVETMTGHTDAVLHVSYSPDGKKLASGGGDMAVRFWNVITSTPSHTCTGHRNHVLCTAWSPDGQVFVSADKSGEIRVWDPKTGNAIGQPLIGHKKWVTSISFEPYHRNPNCCRLASASKDNTIKIWNIKTGQCETTISGHTDSVECVKWGGQGLLYTASRDRTIKVWDVDGHGRSQQKLVRTLTGHGHRINTLALNSDFVLRTGPFSLGKPAPSSIEEGQALALARFEVNKL